MYFYSHIYCSIALHFSCNSMFASGTIFLSPEVLTLIVLFMWVYWWETLLSFGFGLFENIFWKSHSWSIFLYFLLDIEFYVDSYVFFHPLKNTPFHHLPSVKPIFFFFSPLAAYTFSPFVCGPQGSYYEMAKCGFFLGVGGITHLGRVESLLLQRSDFFFLISFLKKSWLIKLLSSYFPLPLHIYIMAYHCVPSIFYILCFFCF